MKEMLKAWFNIVSGRRLATALDRLDALSRRAVAEDAAREQYAIRERRRRRR